MDLLKSIPEQTLALAVVWALPILLGVIIFLVALGALLRLNRLRRQQQKALERVDDLLAKVTTALDRYLTRTEAQTAVTIERGLEHDLKNREA